MKLSPIIKSSLFILTVCLLASPAFQAFAKVGVGVGAGEIHITEPIHPGGIYTLPELRIFNTGDETTTYKMDIAYHQDHPEHRPASSWFTFDPLTFTLDGGNSQEIKVGMTVPVKAEPGDYFAFIESGPVTATASSSGTSVGVAVATKLFFTVEPANLWEGILYRVSSFLKNNSPWSWIGLAVLSCIILFTLFVRFFSFNVSLKKKNQD